MSLKEKLTDDMKQAMRDKEGGKLRLSVIRMVRANIKNVEIDRKQELSDDEVSDATEDRADTESDSQDIEQQLVDDREKIALFDPCIDDADGFSGSIFNRVISRQVGFTNNGRLAPIGLSLAQYVIHDRAWTQLRSNSARAIRFQDVCRNTGITDEDRCGTAH